MAKPAQAVPAFTFVEPKPSVEIIDRDTQIEIAYHRHSQLPVKTLTVPKSLFLKGLERYTDEKQ